MYEGWNIGSTTVKRVRICDDGSVEAATVQHGGNPEGAVRSLLAQGKGSPPRSAVVTGPGAASLLALSYVPESVCIEAALRHLGLTPDLLMSLGSETFVVYCLREGAVCKMLSSTRCAAGSGEFLVQQLKRMGMELEQGLAQAQAGHLVPLASRCSVHCKSDATHKLNKGECTRADIAYSLIADLAQKICALAATTDWPMHRAIVVGGMAQNQLLLSQLRKRLPQVSIDVIEHSPHLEALGAAVLAKQDLCETPPVEQWLRPQRHQWSEFRPPLRLSCSNVDRRERTPPVEARAGMGVILGVDAGSTTTKAVLIDRDSTKMVASVYLRTLGNPVQATSKCLEALAAETHGTSLDIVQLAVTGSGREMVSVFFDNCLIFNEILAHARAARQYLPQLDTIFEIGGQDSKFIALLEGVPVDYSMNDGCSAGTGSFLEEVARSDLHMAVEEIGQTALSGDRPLAFGERCAAFITSDIRTATQQNVGRADIVAGVVYSIVDNYLARVVGTRQIGEAVVLQGGVALNPAVPAAVASLTGRKVVVPPWPELMGCLGAALSARDSLETGHVTERHGQLGSFANKEMRVTNTFTCRSCENVCEVQEISIGEGQPFPFGGLCSKWEMQRRPKELRQTEGRDLVAERTKLMLEAFAPEQPAKPQGRIGIPLALSVWELFPLYARLVTALGFQYVLSRPGQGDRRTQAPMCYPIELYHAAVDDLLAQGVDFLLLPYLGEMEIPEGHAHGYLCPLEHTSPDLVRHIFEKQADRFLTPYLNLSRHMLRTTHEEIRRVAAELGHSRAAAKCAFEAACQHQQAFGEAYLALGREAMATLEGPAVVLAGRPYLAFSAETNLAIPRKIASRGFSVIPADMIPFAPPPNRYDVWHATQQTASAVAAARRHEDWHVCYLSCFSCMPDGITLHRLRHDLQGRPFAYLEIDSHTAHAGIETRIGAFLDIIEERRQHNIAAESSRRSSSFRHARTERRGSDLRIVTSAGDTVGLDAPDALHVVLTDLPQISQKILASLFSNFGWRLLPTKSTDHQLLQAGRQVCSGKECLPFISMVGKMIEHLKQRPPDEITVFQFLDQEGPCAVGSFYDAFEVIMERLGAENTVAVWPTIKNNYLGKGEGMAVRLVAALLVGDLTGEIRSTLRILARDPEQALVLLDQQEEEIVRAARKGLVATELELKRVARRLAGIPLAGAIADTPKVLLCGGVNRIFVSSPITEFFDKRGILTKIVDLSEFISILECEHVIAPSFKRGHIHPSSQTSWARQLAGLAGGGAETRMAMRARIHITMIDALQKRWRKRLARSGLLFDRHIPFLSVLEEGHAHTTSNCFTEVPFATGRYLASLKDCIYDGIVNVGCFSCTPAKMIHAVVRATANQSEIPYAVVEADSSGAITASQLRELEAVAEQSRRRRSDLVRSSSQR